MNKTGRGNITAGLTIALALLLAACGPIEGPQDLFALFLPDPTPTPDAEDIILEELEDLPLGEEPAIRFVTGSKSRANCAEGFGGTACDITARMEVFYTGLSAPALIRCTDVHNNEFGSADATDSSGTVEFVAFHESEALNFFEDPEWTFARCELILAGTTTPADIFTVRASEVEWE